MVMADFSPTHPGEERFGVVRVDIAVEAVGFLMVDSVHREPAMKIVPCHAFIGINRGSARDPGADEVERGALGSEHARECLAIALADHDHGLALAGLILP